MFTVDEFAMVTFPVVFVVNVPVLIVPFKVVLAVPVTVIVPVVPAIVPKFDNDALSKVNILLDAIVNVAPLGITSLAFDSVKLLVPKKKLVELEELKRLNLALIAKLAGAPPVPSCKFVQFVRVPIAEVPVDLG